MKQRLKISSMTPMFPPPFFECEPAPGCKLMLSGEFMFSKKFSFGYNSFLRFRYFLEIIIFFRCIFQTVLCSRMIVNQVTMEVLHLQLIPTPQVILHIKCFLLFFFSYEVRTCYLSYIFPSLFYLCKKSRI
uniref:Uncharacterized protein n=1 Tax=Heterorhabditis bacteriophora TaxID=37862 RepID=A0A1I7WH23_HETBA